MKQLLFLLLFPCLAMAQYTGNAGQKITLGEQTTADGLVYRGLAADTTRKPSVDTMAFILLDTNTNIIWQYKKAVNNAWTRVGGSISSGVTGVLPVANGGTGASVRTFVDTISTQTVGGQKTFTEITKITNTTNSTSTTTGALIISGGLGINNKLYGKEAFFEGVFTATGPATGTAFFLKKTGNTDVFALNINDNDTWTMFDNFGLGSSYNEGITQKNGNLGIKTQDPSEALHVVGNARITAMNGINDIGASATGVLQAATSDMNLKNTIENSPFGLNEILLLNPVTFLYNDENRKIDSDVKEVGFIAQDVFDIIPNAVSSTGTGDLQLDYRAITATLVKAIQEQQSLIKALEQRILILENK